MDSKENENNALLDILIQTTNAFDSGIILLNADGHILSVNDRFATDLGYTTDHFEPKTIFEVNPTTSILSWKKLWKEVLKNGKISLKTEQITADEAIYPVKMKGILIEMEDKPLLMASVQNLMQKDRYKDLLDLTSEISGVGCWEWDLVQNEFMFSKEMYKLLHLDEDSQMSKKSSLKLITQLLSENDLPIFKANLKTAIDKGKGFEMEVSMKVSGSYQNYNFNAQPVWLEDQTIKICGTLQNLSKISKRTDDLYFTKFCLDSARDMIFWLEPDATISYMNQAALDKLGYAPEEIIGKSVKFISQQSEIALDDHWKELKKEKSLEFESVHVTKDGKELPVSIIANYISFRDREFNCGFVRDLSGKKKRDEIITMAKYSLDQSIDMIFWLNPDGTFKYFNNTFTKTTGYTRAEINNMLITDFFPNTSKADFEAGWKKLLEGHTLKSVDREMKLKNGKTIHTEMTVNIVRAGNKSYSSTVLRDIQERKGREKEEKKYLAKIEALQKQTMVKNITLQEEVDLKYNFDNIISKDPNYKKVLRQVEQVADTNATVLILGETGTGKELLARAVHKLSEREDMPMIKVNCGALPENLIESELFGHEKGSFTGAYQRKIGKFERADKGTIFLDEIGELPLDLQAKLLRVLQEGEIERIGGDETIKIDVRVIAATNRNLEQQVQDGQFREDLYYRLNVFPIYNIPLRERREDIPILIKYFTEKYSKKINKEIKEISTTSMNKLMAYDFLGNVRELENIVERSVILSKSNVLTFDALIAKKGKSGPSKFKTLDEMQKSHIINALKITKGKVSGEMGAAEILGMNDKTLTSRMRKLKINKKDYIKTI